MNRRKVLVGLLAAPLVAMLPTGYVSGFQTKLKRYLFVVPTQRQAAALYKRIGRPENVKVISVGAMICGYGADLIVMDENCRTHPVWGWSQMRRKHYDDWFNNMIRTRLYRGGRIITRRLV